MVMGAKIVAFCKLFCILQCIRKGNKKVYKPTLQKKTRGFGIISQDRGIVHYKSDALCVWFNLIMVTEHFILGEHGEHIVSA